MLKKGQLTLFFIIGLVIIVVFGIGTLMESEEINPQRSGTADLHSADPVTTFVESCLLNSLHEGVVAISLQGGYYLDVPEGIDYSFFTVPYYNNRGVFSVPSVPDLERELELFIGENIDSCFNDFVDLKSSGTFVRAEKGHASVTLSENGIDATFTMPVTVGSGVNTRSLDSFFAKSEFNFKRIQSIVEELMVDHQSEPNMMPIGNILYSANENGYDPNIVYITDEIILFSLLFDDVIEDHPFVFNYAAHYDWSEELAEFVDVEIDPIETLTIRANQEFNYQVTASKPHVIFTDYGDLFDIDPIFGTIKFTPTLDDVGQHSALIKVEDIFGNTDFTYMEVEVVE